MIDLRDGVLPELRLAVVERDEDLQAREVRSQSAGQPSRRDHDGGVGEAVDSL